jgi:hypothetical protein
LRKTRGSPWISLGVAATLLLAADAVLAVGCGSTNQDAGSDGGVNVPPPADGVVDAGAVDAGASQAAPPDDATIRDATSDASPDGNPDATHTPCDVPASPAAWPDASTPFEVQALRSGTYSAWNQTWTYQLLRLTNAAGGYAYAEWMPHHGTGAGPVMVVTVPYDGIDWSGEAVDTKWASHLFATFGYSSPDVDGPDGSVSSPSIQYQLVSPEDEMGKLGFPHFLNDMSVLLIYGRFYAGGSLDTYVGAMQAGMRFLAQAPEVDPARVGVFGASWGGFEAAYTAAYAEPGVVPAVSVPMSPALDFSVLATHATTGLDASVPAADLSEFKTFYEPYMRRVFAATGGPPSNPGSDYSHYTGSALCARLDKTSLLIPQDDWDTLIPVDEAKAFVQSCPCHATGLWYQHLGPAPSIQLSHGPMPTGVSYTNDAGVRATGLPSAFTFSFAYVYARLLPASATVLLPYGAPDILQFLQSVHDWQRAGRDVSYVAPRLIDIAQPNVQVYDATGTLPSPMSGPAMLAALMAQVWPNGGIDKSNVLTALETTGLPSP